MKLTVLALIIAVIGAAGYLLVRENRPSSGILQRAQPTPWPWPLVSPNSQPSPIRPSASTDPTANWKTYQSDTLGITFRYPPDYVIEISGQYSSPNLAIVPSDERDTSPMFSIRAEQQGDDVSFDRLISGQRRNLVDVKTEVIANGIKISGLTGSGYTETMIPSLGPSSPNERIPVILAVLKYKRGVIIFENIRTTQSELFDQILYTLRFE